MKTSRRLFVEGSGKNGHKIPLTKTVKETLRAASGVSA